MTEFEKEMLKGGYAATMRDVSKLTDEDFSNSRHNGFGASEAAILLGVGFAKRGKEGKTRDQLYREKLEEYHDDSIGQFSSVRKGKELEHIFIEKAKEQLQQDIFKPDESYICYKTGLAVNFDSVFMYEGHYIPVEIKLATTYGRNNYNFKAAYTEEEEDVRNILTAQIPEPFEISNGNPTSLHHGIKGYSEYHGYPAYYYAQLQQQMYYLKPPFGILAVMDEFNWRMNYFKVSRSDFVIKILAERARYLYAMLSAKKGLRFDG